MIELWEGGMARLLETTCHADPLVRRFRYALATLLVRPLLHKELEAISCEARRWRLGVLVHDRIINPKTGSVYQPRCYRRGDKRPTRAQPPPDAIWQVGVPSMAKGRVTMVWHELGDFAPAP